MKTVVSRRHAVALLAGAGLASACAAGAGNAVVSDGVLHVRPGAAAAGVRSGQFRFEEPPRPLAFIPPSLDRSKPAPMMLLLHGAGGRGDRILRRFMPMAEARGVILLAPDSDLKTWDAIRGMQYGTTPAFGADVARVEQALALMFGEALIDPQRLAIAGFSDGASYALSLGLPNAGLFSHIIAMSPGGVAPFAGRAQAQVFVSHGRKDSILAYDNTAKGIVPGVKGLGLPVEFVSFDGDHELRDAEMRAAFDWFLAR
jgi:phospholipase/carboxylesterase